MRKGFTLVELLVVLLIIAILVAILAPRAQQAVLRAKETAVKAHCAGIELGLGACASRSEFGGFYPGLAEDWLNPQREGGVMHALGDPTIYVGTLPQTGFMMHGVLGGVGHLNQGLSTSAFQQISNLDRLIATNLANLGNLAVQDTGGGDMNEPRTLDALILHNALPGGEYPGNPLLSPTLAGVTRMRNIFWISATPDLFVDFSNLDNLNDEGLDVNLACSKIGDAAGYANIENNSPNTIEAGRLIEQFPVLIAAPYDPVYDALDPARQFNPEVFARGNIFGTDETDFFAPGDFAYVPVLSTSSAAALDNPLTVSNEAYDFGVAVRDYLMFAFGSAKGDQQRFQQEQTAYAYEGLPGYGAPGIDTRYEMSVLCLFNGAVYFSKSY
jgi:prepilin-type N-terminal cleavage/methylation domain-containing protein